MEDGEDCWDAFGSSSDEDEDTDGGSDVDNDDDEIEHTQTGVAMDAKAASAIAMHLSQEFLKRNPQVRLSDRTVAVICLADKGTTGGDTKTNDCKCTVSKHLEQRQIRVVRQRTWKSETPIPSFFDTLDTMVDALIVLDEVKSSSPISDEKKSDDNNPSTSSNSLIQNLVESILCPGGVLVFSRPSDCETSNHNSFRDIKMEKLVGSDAIILCSASSIHSGTVHWIARRKKSVRVHTSTCPWLSSSHSITSEEERLHLATVALSSHEMASSPCSSSSGDSSSTKTPRRASKLTDYSVRKAVKNMKEYGYCILPGLLDRVECKEWGSTFLDCIHDASKILLERDGVNIYNPQSSDFEPQSYREMSMREDLRMDLRHGPAISKLRARKEDSAEAGGKSILLTASEDKYGDGLFLRGHPSILEIIRKTMNPGSASSDDERDVSCAGSKKPLYLGNIGRWNFGGTGNNGSYQDLRISPIGGIVSLPGSADQALHADTSHLFEHVPDLPAHYINVFAPCTAFHPRVGGTAFVHGSHDLAFTAKHYDANHNSSFYPFLVRPEVTLGDVILFDCRILHFGLANTSKSTERCICYVNTWHDWFHDAKNWDKNRAIFEDNGEQEDR